MTGEDEEFAMFFREYYPSLCRFLECLLGGGGGRGGDGGSVAEDLAQESFMRLHHTGLRSLPEGEARFWLFRVARNFALNELSKGQTRHRLFGKVVEAFNLRSAATTPEREYELNERRRIVLDMLKSLPEDQRAALLLREQEGMSYREIAHVLNVSESKVKVDVFRARGALRERWGRAQKMLTGAAG
ncbi:MAG: RNA polymerase sigma factor [Pyrinomonadaceae bacterium]